MLKLHEKSMKNYNFLCFSIIFLCKENISNLQITISSVHPVKFQLVQLFALLLALCRNTLKNVEKRGLVPPIQLKPEFSQIMVLMRF